MTSEAISAVVNLFAGLAGPAFGIAFIFAFGGKLVRSFLSMAFEGRFRL